ncbi:hypothetical protein O7627_26735 [Solwaraspora sp. WMMD1047]|uniref:hypothetical protein n=1 Tax=Solwaraspora sp. WMMD1047 TaxID=3016102 RepID=UPI0024167A06|nr:hypothetical protein [Solwaraspora sp. WMMD1047]MDG4832875.1 hypothetical protein [Solwaraspora sp. WMMD1047]
MADTPEDFERRIAELRAAVRRSLRSGDRARAESLRAELRAAEHGWDQAVGLSTGRRPGSLVPLREQVQHALTLLSVPAAPKLIVEVHTAFLGSGGAEITGAQLTHLRRDEERSFRSAPQARPYYLCSALTAEHLTPVRGLLAVSTWPLDRRMVGPLSPRVHFLTAAIRIAEQAAGPAGQRAPGARSDPPPAVARLLWRFAVNIPGALDRSGPLTPAALADAARAELAAQADADRSHRAAGAELARSRLDSAGQLFGRRPEPGGRADRGAARVRFDAAPSHPASR